MDPTRFLPNRITPARRAAALALMAWALLGVGAAHARRDEAAPFPARAGVELAADAARAWSPDAALVYVENDEPLDDAGGAGRWSYLYFSPSLEKSRVYSVREGRIVVAEGLEMKFAAPALQPGWLDSGAALAAAEDRIGRRFRREYGGSLSTMLLVRGALQEGDPDASCWMLVYTAGDAPALFVVVDAADGRVRRTWRG